MFLEAGKRERGGNRQVPERSRHDKNRVRGAARTSCKFDTCNSLAGGRYQIISVILSQT